ncbi:MAG: ankyrin repeat domain-containing protein, partial [Methylococcales bacterium]
MNELSHRNGDTLSPILRMAALNGVQDTVHLHLCRSNNVNSTDGKGRSLLMLAASRGHVGLCRFLIEAGAFPGLVDHDGNDASAIAHANGYADIVALLREFSVPYSAAELQKEISRVSNQGPLMETNDEETGGEKYGLSVWAEDQDSPPPNPDKECIQAASTLQHQISAHTPIDTEENWSDVEIDLPESQRERNRRGVRDEKRRITSLDFILQGLRDGSVQRWRMDQSTTDAEDQPYAEFGAHLALVLGQLGIIIDETSLEWDSETSDRDAELDPDSDAENELLAEEALSFLDLLASNEGNPGRHYFRNMKQLGFAEP